MIAPASAAGHGECGQQDGFISPMRDDGGVGVSARSPTDQRRVVTSRRRVVSAVTPRRWSPGSLWSTAETRGAAVGRPGPSRGEHDRLGRALQHVAPDRPRRGVAQDQRGGTQHRRRTTGRGGRGCRSGPAPRVAGPSGGVATGSSNRRPERDGAVAGNRRAHHAGTAADRAGPASASVESQRPYGGHIGAKRRPVSSRNGWN
jgi:hypothetical protein